MLQTDLLVGHLAPDGVGLLLPAGDLRLDADLFQLASECGANVLHEPFVGLSQLGELLSHRGVGFRVEPAERVILQLLAHRFHAHAAGERRIDVDRLFRIALTRFGLHMLKGAHVVQTVGKLHQEHANVARDCDEQLAEILGLFRLLGHKVQAPDLCQPIDKRADLGTKQLINFCPRGFGILNDIVQQRRHDGCAIEFEVGKDGCNFEGV